MANDKTVETHILAGATEAKVEITADGCVWIWIGGEVVSAEWFSEIVGFVERHGDILVVNRDG